VNVRARRGSESLEWLDRLAICWSEQMKRVIVGEKKRISSRISEDEPSRHHSALTRDCARPIWSLKG